MHVTDTHIVGAQKRFPQLAVKNGQLTADDYGIPGTDDCSHPHDEEPPARLSDIVESTRQQVRLTNATFNQLS